MKKYHVSFTPQDKANIPDWKTKIAGVLYKGEDVFMCFPIGTNWDEKDAKGFAVRVSELLNGDDKAAERKGFTCTSCGNQFLQSVCTTCRAEKLYDNTLKAAEQRAEAAERRLNYVLDNTPLSRVENMLSIKVFSLTGESATRNERCCAAIDAALERREHYSAPPMKEEGK